MLHLPTVTSAKPRPHRRSLLRGRWRAPHSPGLMHRGASEAPFRHRHLLGIEGLSPDDINHVLDLADGYVELNRQAEKKHGLLRGGTIINLLLRELDAHPHLVRGSPAIGQPMRRIGLADPLNWIDDLRTKPGAPPSCPAARPPAVEKHKEKSLGGTSNPDTGRARPGVRKRSGYWARYISLARALSSLFLFKGKYLSGVRVLPSP